MRAEIIIDGIIDEIEWNDAQVFDEFVTVEPLSGDSAKYKTEVKLLTNPQGIYVAFLNYQPPSVKRVDRRFARDKEIKGCLLYTSPSPRDATLSRMPSSA